MEQSECEANAMHLHRIIKTLLYQFRIGTHRKNTVAFLSGALHLDIVETPFLNEFDCHISLHDPGEDRIKGKNNLKARFKYAPCTTQLPSLTANPTRVAIEELQLQDLKNNEAAASQFHTKRGEFMKSIPA